MMKWILRSPLHGLASNSTMLISVTGLKSRRTITTPVNFLNLDGSYFTLSSRDRTWWKNLRGGQPCILWLAGSAYPAKGTLIEEADEVEKLLFRIVQVAPVLAKYLNIHMGPDDIPIPGDLWKAAGSWVVVRFELLKGRL